MKPTIVGAGRIGTALSQMCDANVVRRGQPIPTAEGPIYVCTRNDDLESVVGATLPQHRKDLVFLQNGMLQSWLDKHNLQDNTQALIYFAVQKLGDKPVDGGGSVVCGPWAETFAQMLQSAGLECTVVDRQTYRQQMVEKMLWNCIFGLLSQKHNTSVGHVVERFRNEVDDLVGELAPLAEKKLRIRLKSGIAQRLCDYSMSVADYKGAVKELPWRNGWFLDIAHTPKHVEWLQQVGVSVSG